MAVGENNLFSARAAPFQVYSTLNQSIKKQEPDCPITFFKKFLTKNYRRQTQAH